MEDIMKNEFIFSVAVALMFLGCTVEMADYEKADTKTPGTEGGYCLEGDVCAKGLECFHDICVKEEPVVKDEEEVVDKEETTDVDNNAATLEQNECFGMVATYDVVPHKIVTYGTKSFQRDIYPEEKVVIAGDDACSMIAYNASGAIIAPIKCEGVHYTTDSNYETCTYVGALDLVDGSKGCNWNCVDYR
jgi:hypothetical protein